MLSVRVMTFRGGYLLGHSINCTSCGLLRHLSVVMTLTDCFRDALCCYGMLTMATFGPLGWEICHIAAATSQPSVLDWPEYSIGFFSNMIRFEHKKLRKIKTVLLSLS